MDQYYKECFLEDIYHFEALDVWDKLYIGTHVEFDLVDNMQKIKVSVNENGIRALGMLSEEDSKSMLPFYKCGWKNLFFGKICYVDKDMVRQRIKIVVYIAPYSANNG